MGQDDWKAFGVPFGREISLIIITQHKMADEYIGDWTNIPQDAFRYFPQGEQIIVGNEEKQWRKIFEGGQTYNAFENQALAKLQKRLQEQNVSIDPWFDLPNKLRFLQANKFKTSKTIDSMTQTSKWRSSNFPVSMDYATEQLLNSGAFYFCGRDDKYRPILVVDIGKFDPDADDDNDAIQKALVIIMEFMIKELLIEGQVENYVLIMNLEKATFSLRGIIMKILSFTSNAYRGRLFASYILSMPTLIRWGWDAIVSKFVSENTLKKLKISGDPFNDEMWTHISKKTVEYQYNGHMPNLNGPYWPPRRQHLIFTDPERAPQNSLISVDQYVRLFKEQKLIGRKILKKSIVHELQTISAPLAQNEDYVDKTLVSNGGVIPIRDYGALRQSSHWRAEVVIKKQTPFDKDHKVIHTFFQLASFRRICPIITQQ